MIWLTWRQFRIQAWAGLAILVIVAGTLLATAPRLFDIYDSSSFAACSTACGEVADAFVTEVRQASLMPVYLTATAVMFVLPALVGVFWGAPLVARELESGTHRLAWSQTVTRGRWIVVKLAGGGLAAMLLAGLVSLAVTWWTGPLDEAGAGRVAPLIFAARGVVPLGSAAFAFVTGVLVGLLTRRTVLAMAVTLVLVALAQVAMPTFLRPALGSPAHAVVAYDSERIEQLGIRPDQSISIFLGPPVDHAWVLANRTIDTSGREFEGPVDATRCGRQGSPDDCHAWLDTLGLRQEVSYVPPERFWTLQWRELAVFAGVTVLLSLFCVWWIRRRVA